MRRGGGHGDDVTLDLHCSKQQNNLDSRKAHTLKLKRKGVSGGGGVLSVLKMCGCVCELMRIVVC